ncbi:aspartic proteinase CDR1-like [Papaver somniferum]|uniref:aspartic proteinase CDR1-like n=1 Tax=Papaver somniferum TaxID=3469 RepID=UPI000E6F925A|nr:aspartic proteinase CDR1-like [Papaver somniferum]
MESYWIKINMDGAVMGHPGMAGAGFICRDSSAQTVMALVQPLGIIVALIDETWATLGLDTFSNLPQAFKNYFLMVDSGSDLIWTQCQGGSSYFHQDEPYYPAQGSSVLAKEKFTVNSDNDGLEYFDMILGIGTNQVNFEPFFGLGFMRRQPDVIVGILRLDGNPRSFLNQLDPAGEGKFAYCLKPYTDGTTSSTYLRFGSDAIIGGKGQQVYQIPLFFHRHDPGACYLNLEDISVGEIRIIFQSTDFQYKEDTGRGGCFIDSRSPLTSFPEAQITA